MAKINKYSEASDRLEERIRNSTNSDQKSSALFCLLEHCPGAKLENFIDILKIHNEEPQIWAKIEKYLIHDSDQRLGAILNVIGNVVTHNRQPNWPSHNKYYTTLLQLSGWLSRHSLNSVNLFYSNLNKKYILILKQQFKNEENIILIKKLIYEKRNNWNELKQWLLIGSK